MTNKTKKEKIQEIMNNIYEKISKIEGIIIEKRESSLLINPGLIDVEYSGIYRCGRFGHQDKAYIVANCYSSENSKTIFKRVEFDNFEIEKFIEKIKELIELKKEERLNEVITQQNENKKT